MKILNLILLLLVVVGCSTNLSFEDRTNAMPDGHFVFTSESTVSTGAWMNESRIEIVKSHNQLFLNISSLRSHMYDEYVFRNGGSYACKSTKTNRTCRDFNANYSDKYPTTINSLGNCPIESLTNSSPTFTATCNKRAEQFGGYSAGTYTFDGSILQHAEFTKTNGGRKVVLESYAKLTDEDKEFLKNFQK